MLQTRNTLSSKTQFQCHCDKWIDCSLLSCAPPWGWAVLSVPECQRANLSFGFVWIIVAAADSWSWTTSALVFSLQSPKSEGSCVRWGARRAARRSSSLRVSFFSSVQEKMAWAIGWTGISLTFRGSFLVFFKYVCVCISIYMEIYM